VFGHPASHRVALWNVTSHYTDCPRGSATDAPFEKWNWRKTDIIIIIIIIIIIVIVIIIIILESEHMHMYNAVYAE